MTESTKQLSNKEKKLCPRCGKPGSGPYSRWVKNSKGKRYEPYQYFAHREGGRVSWCYLGKKKPELDNMYGSNSKQGILKVVDVARKVGVFVFCRIWTKTKPLTNGAYLPDSRNTSTNTRRGY
jgi:hypothetical protein